MFYLGVDLRTSPKHPSAVSVIDNMSRLGFISSFSADSELFKIIEKYQPEVIAIGTPLGLPDGLCCLEPTCECKPTTPQKKGRQSEMELARMGIGCFFTNKGSIIRRLIYRAIRINRQLTDLGYNTIEVYPYGAKVVLFGDKVPPKNSPKSLSFLRERLPTLIEGLDSNLSALDRNSCDSLINAHTALLHSHNATDLVGTASEGFVALPKLIRIDAGQQTEGHALPPPGSPIDLTPTQPLCVPGGQQGDTCSDLRFKASGQL